MNQALLKTWYPYLKDELEMPYFTSLKTSLMNEYTTTKVHPHPSEIFRAFEVTPFESVKVCIIGQDPYPFGNHADGLAFSSKEKDTPASLRTIFREVDRDVVRSRNKEEFKRFFPDNNLKPWADQGVLLLNSCLTVRDESPGSHAKFGWDMFTGKAVELLMRRTTQVVFLVWGKAAADMVAPELLTTHPHLILYAGHPASGSHGKDTFSGCNHFSQANHFLIKHNLTPINWKLHE